MFLVIAIVTAVAAVVPLLRGRSLNVTLLVVAALWLIVAMVMAGRASARSGADRD